MQGSPISDETKVCVSDQQVSTEVGGEAVILNFDAGAYYGLDKVGARIWELLRSPVTVPELCDHVTAEFDVERGRCESDVRALLSELADAGLIDVGVS